MRRKLILITAALVAMPGVALCQSRLLASVEETKKVAEAIVASVAASNFDGAMKEMKPLSVIPPAEFDVFDAQVKSQTGTLLQRFGSPTGYELIREERLGARLVRYQFLVFHEKAPIRWMFIFYKGEKGWWMTDFKFDANATSFFPAGG